MKLRTLKRYFIALLASLIAFTNLSVGRSASAMSDTASNRNNASLHKTWEANENGTAYKIIKISDGRFLVVYGTKNSISGYITYDRKNGSNGTDYLPWTSVSSNITIGIQETSSQSIGVMLSIDGETSSFVANPYRPDNKTRNTIRPGSWRATISDTPVQLRIDNNLADVSVDIGKCRLSGTIKSDGSGGVSHLTLAPATTTCAAKFNRQFTAALFFSDDLTVIYTTGQQPTNFIFVAPQTIDNAPGVAPQPRNMSCAQWREMCRAKCSAMTLPTGNFGFKFWNCVNSCNALAGC
ncbi:hypothetical protein [Burkholderia stabilis]|uniref:hypothetical protein n=1 Tax=Burkholderia stabilis TaxID=95485 RepID=UPI0015922AA3|nr:hypothetical protein [Burkholderia stabilis]